MRAACLILIAAVLSPLARAGEVLDRIVATVDKHAITRSDVEQEARFSHLADGKAVEITLQDEIAALDRLVDRDLVSDQILEFGAIPVTDKELDARIAEMRKQIPGAESDSGWQHLLQENGLTEEDVESRIRQEIQTLHFVDLRFRSEVRVGPRSIQTYYETRFVPDLKKRGLAPPPLEKVQDQIEAILREERVNGLISDWLKSLRTQSRIQAFDSSLPLTGFERRPADISDLHFLPLHITGPAEAAKQ